MSAHPSQLKQFANNTKLLPFMLFVEEVQPNGETKSKLNKRKG